MQSGQASRHALRAPRYALKLAARGCAQVFVNGVWVGIHRDPHMLVRTLRQLRRQVDVSSEVSVVHDMQWQEIRIYTDYGRVCRPLFIVENQRLLIQKVCALERCCRHFFLSC